MSTKKKLNVSNKGGSTTDGAVISQLEEVRSQLYIASEAIADRNNTIDRQCDVINHNANKAVKLDEQLNHVKTQMFQSLVQERTDLVGRLMRVDQRLAVLGVDAGTANSFSLAITE